MANELGGRYVEFKIYSLSYVEFLEFHNMADSDKSLESYIHYGGLPYLMHLPTQEDVIMEYLQSIYSTIVLRDLVQRKIIRNTAFLEQLIKFPVRNVGCLFSSKSISDFFKNQLVDISSNKVNDYAR